MKLKLLVMVTALLAACSNFEDTPGQVSGVDDRGRFVVVGPKQFGVDAAPSERMMQQAREVCPNAKYLESRPSTADFNLFEHEFKC